VLAALVLQAGLAAAEVSISDAWVRALPPTQQRTAAYLTLHNSGPQRREITGGSAELAGRVEIHESREVEGYMRMMPVNAVSLPPGGDVQLAPGGVHLMLLELVRMPVPGEQLELCLTLADGEEICTRAAVRRSAADDTHSGHH
jgi:copper(I)-binding protein